LSAAGLVYKHYGIEITENALNSLFDTSVIKDTKLRQFVNKESIAKITENLYENFFVTLDAIDNGIDQYPKDVKPKYRFYHTHLAARVSRLNPNFWDDEMINSDERFKEAMKIAQEEYLAQVISTFMSLYASRPIVNEAIEKRLEHHSSGKVIVLSKSCFWKEALFTYEKENDMEGHFIFVIYKDSSSGSYRCQAVPKVAGTFENRGGLKEEWRGKTEEEVAQLSGLPDAVFCHHSGFIGGAKSLESTLKMADMSLPKDEETLVI